MSPSLADDMAITGFLRDIRTPAIYSASTRDFITHAQLKDFVQGFRLPARNIGRNVVAVALPNGPMLAAAIIAVSTYYTAAPITPAVGVEQFKADVLQAGANIVLTTQEDAEKLGLNDLWVSEAGIQICLARLESDMVVTITDDAGLNFSKLPMPEANGPRDTAIQLFTSGTSGTKKLVPISAAAVLGGAQMVVKSWGLNTDETCLNMMPLHHM
jgi:acyl-coenzyme A synthetase/AMP-(fatty) acid ligase